MTQIPNLESLKSVIAGNLSEDAYIEVCFMDCFAFTRQCQVTYGPARSSFLSILKRKTALAEEVVRAGRVVLWQDGFNEPNDVLEFIDEMNPEIPTTSQFWEDHANYVVGNPEDRLGAVTNDVSRNIDLYASLEEFPDLTEADRFDVAYGRFFAEHIDLSQMLNADRAEGETHWKESEAEFHDESTYHFQSSSIFVDGKEILLTDQSKVAVAGNYLRDGSFQANGMIRKRLNEMVFVMKADEEQFSVPITSSFRERVLRLASCHGEK